MTIDETKGAEKSIVQCVQYKAFSDIISRLKSKNDQLPKSCNLKRLSPFLSDNLIRVGGRLGMSWLEYDQKHPLLLPNFHRFTQFVIEYYHRQNGHVGMGIPWAVIRQKYRIVKGGAEVRQVLGHCLSCRKRNGPLGKQLMAELPPERTASDKPPFAATGVNYFGPFFQKFGGCEHKRYVCIYLLGFQGNSYQNCRRTVYQLTRLLHVYVGYSFIACLRRLIGCKESSEKIFCDNGTNFHGAERVLKSELRNWNQQRVDTFMQQ